MILRLLATQDRNFPSSAAWLGDVNGDGFEDFAAGGQNGCVIDGTLRSSGWIEATRETIGAKLLAELQSPEGLQPGVHGGSADRELFADLGDPKPDNGIRERLIVCGEPRHDNGGAIAAFLLAPRGDGSFDAREVAFLEPWGSIGHDLAALGDVDGDHVGDVAVFQPGFEPSGRVLVLSGAGLVDGFQTSDVIQDLRPDATFQFYETMRKIGDQDGDGHDELLVAGLSREDATYVVAIYDILGASEQPADCNQNGVPDECDVASGTSKDSNANGHPDECEKMSFHRGDANGDGLTDISDAIASLRFLFLGGPVPPCLDAADSNGDDRHDVSDAVFTLYFLFVGGRPPPVPGPAPAGCGLDPGEEIGLGCIRYDSC